MGREKSEIWQVGCRAVSKRDTSFSAWLGDNDEPQIRMNEKVLRNLSAMLQRPMRCQGCWTHIPIFPSTENAIHIPYTNVIILHLVMQNKCLGNDFTIKLDDKKKRRNSFVAWSMGCTHDVLCHGSAPHIWKQSEKAQKRYKRIESITGCRVSKREAHKACRAQPFKW